VSEGDIENITNKEAPDENTNPEARPAPLQNSPAEKPKKKKSFLGRVVKFFIITITLLLLLVVGLVLFLQTSYAKNWLLQFALDKVNESLISKESRISAESIEGSIINELKLNKANITVKGDTLLRFEYIDLNYDLWGIPNKNVYVTKISLNNPVVNLTKVKSGDSLIWNLNHILKSDKPDDEDTTKKPFDWKITVDKLEILNGNFRILSEKKSTLPIGQIPVTNIQNFGIDNLFVSNFNLELSAKVYPDAKSVDIKKVSFNTNSDFNVKNLSLQAKLQKNKLSQVNNLNLVTNRSTIDIKTVSLEDFDPLEQKIDYSTFDARMMTLDILTDKFDFDDLKFFLPDLDFLDGRVYLNFKVKGKYNNFTFDKLQLKTDNSVYNLAGTVKNLDEPGKLFLDVTSNQSEIDPVDTKILIPGLPVPDYSHIGKIRADFHFVGEPIDFTVDIDMNTSAGNISGKGSLNLKPREAVYSGDFKTNSFNLGKLLQIKSLEGTITGDIKADGAGFDYKTTRTNLVYNITNSDIFEQKISKSSGKIVLNGGTADLDVDYNTNYVNSKIAGKVNFRDFNNLQYDLKGNMQNLNIAGLTKNNSQISSLNFTYDIKGSGTSIAGITGDFKLDFTKSYYSKYQIPASPIIGYIHKNGDSTDISFTSNFLQAKASGIFSLATLPDILSSNIEKITGNFQRLIAKDSTSGKLEVIAESNTTPLDTKIPVTSNTRLSYDIKIIDFQPIANLIDYRDINLVSEMKGTLINTNNKFTFSVDTGKVSHFVFQDSVFNLAKANLSMLVINDNNLDTNGFNAKVNFIGDSLVASGMKLDSIYFFSDFRQGYNDFWTKIRKDSTMQIFTKGKFAMGSTRSAFLLDTFALKAGKYLLSDADSIHFYYVTEQNNNYFDIQRFQIQEGRQRINVKGIYSLNDSSDIKATLNNVSIAEIQKYINPDTESQEQIQGNFRRVELIFKGDLANPLFHFEANSDILRMGNTTIGRIDALVDYKEYKLLPDIAFYNQKNEGNMKITGQFPMYLSFTDADTAIIKDKMLTDRINLNVAANNFQIKIIEQILPFTYNLTGTLNGKIDVGGTGSKPLLMGDMNVRKGSFNVDLSKMYYQFEADLATEGQKLLLRTSKLYTPDEDSRFITTTGYIDFSDLKLSDIDLAMTGDVKLFDKNNGNTDLGISGDLYGGSGFPQLRIKGNDQLMQLTGNLTLKKGNITINPFQQETLDLYADDFNYKLIYDSTSYSADSLLIYAARYNDSLKRKQKKELNPFEKYILAQEDSSLVKPEKKSSFIYDISVTNETPIFLRFITNPKYRQEFFGDVNLNLYVDNRNRGNMEARGNVTLGDNSYYKFYKNFDASGSVIFNGPITNPDLRISAKYNSMLYSSSGGDPVPVEIDLNVTGSAVNPTLTWAIYENGSPVNSNDPSSAAIAFILFGTFNISASQNLSINSLTSSVGANIGSVVLSNYFSGFIQEILPFIVNTDLNYVDSKSGNLASNTDLRITAEFGDAIVRVGGQIFDNLNNTNVSIQYPIGKLLNIPGVSNNLFLQIERVVDPLSSNSSGITVQSRDVRTGATVYYRIKF